MNRSTPSFGSDGRSVTPGMINSHEVFQADRPIRRAD